MGGHVGSGSLIVMAVAPVVLALMWCGGVVGQQGLEGRGLCINFVTCEACTSAKWTDEGAFGACAWCTDTNSCAHTAQATCKNWIVTYELCQMPKPMSKCDQALTCTECLEGRFTSADFAECVWCIKGKKCIHRQDPCDGYYVVDDNAGMCKDDTAIQCGGANQFSNCFDCVRARHKPENAGCAWCETDRSCQARYSGYICGAWTENADFCLFSSEN